jgi:hypothetical protein
MSRFKETLREAVRRMSFRTSLDSLKKQGLQHVNVLGLDRIINLMDEAVNRSLKSRLVASDRDAVAEATKAEFLRLMRSNEALQRQKSELERLKESAEEEVDQLRRQLGQDKQALEAKLRTADPQLLGRYAGEDAAIAQRLGEALQLVQGGLAGAPEALHGRVLEVVMDIVAAERRSAELARRSLHDREVDILRRRVEKLSGTLDVTERRLKEVAAMKNIDDGISSIYREVQGIRSADRQVARKRELMAEIFEANRRLQKKAP